MSSAHRAVRGRGRAGNLGYEVKMTDDYFNLLFPWRKLYLKTHLSRPWWEQDDVEDYLDWMLFRDETLYPEETPMAVWGSR